MRKCDECSVCCYMPAMPQLEKPASEWCQHCKIGEGCSIYKRRPQVCLAYRCEWLRDKGAFVYLGEEWKPSKSKILVDCSDRNIFFNVHPDHPYIWKDEPYYSTIVHYMRKFQSSNWHYAAFVVVGERDYWFKDEHWYVAENGQFWRINGDGSTTFIESDGQMRRFVV